MFDGDTLSVSVDIPEGLSSLRMVFSITTGHGGWGGGDEFNLKMNVLLVDGHKIWSYIPWRRAAGCTAISTLPREISGMVFSSSDYSRSAGALDLCPNLYSPGRAWPGKAHI
ncbi:MAG: peptide-N-glycosidase F-related protein [Bacteroidales bacterium]